MKNKFKNHSKTFRSLVYFLSFFLQSCTINKVNHLKVHSNPSEILDHIQHTFNNFSEIPIEKKVDSCVDLVENFLLTFCGKRGLHIGSSSTLRMCAKEGVEKVGRISELAKKFVVEKVGNIYKAPEALKAFPKTTYAKRKTPFQGSGGLRPRWKDNKGKIYEWDNQYGEVELYDKTGKNHLGSFDPLTGKKLKEGIPNRSVSP